MSTGLLLVGHGSREARANEGFAALVAGYRAHLAATSRELEVAHGYVELAEPGLDEALAGLARRHRRVIVAPLFLFMVGHTKNDIPIALARARQAAPDVEFLGTRELGIHPALVQIAYERAAAALPLDLPLAGKTTAVIVGRGSSDPDANAEFYKLARLVAEGRGFGAVVPCFIGITAPLLPAALELAARGRPERVVVVPYFLFDGVLGDKLRAQVAEFSERYPWIHTTVAATLAPDARLHAVLDERIAQALEGRAPLPCDTCQYRAPVSGVVGQVGGLRALLWSLRHGYTHSQAAPHRHAHKPLHKHVLVCGNVDCADGGSIGLIDSLRRLVKAAGRQDDIRVTRTSCMGRCGEGPTVAVYPDGIWYRAVRETDADELVREHLLGDRLVARLVDNIMQ
jgi:sirohydrochlorin ferrochelatase/(2Fe-2S) ferredoxin